MLPTTFKKHTITPITIGNETFLTGEDIGICLGYKDPKKHINNLYNRNHPQFEGGYTLLFAIFNKNNKESIAIETKCKRCKHLNYLEI